MSLAVIAGVLVMPAGSATAVDPIPVKGADASWPNCPKGMGIPSRRSSGLPMPNKDAKFVVLGVTNGPGFYPNPCLARQVKWARGAGVLVGTYAMTTYPTTKQVDSYGQTGPWPATSRVGRLRNAGYAQAEFNLATLKRVGLTTNFMWVDVEPYPVAPWSGSKTRNKAVLDGVLRGYRDAGLSVGFYTSPGPWADIIGSARYRLPEWRTAGGHPWSTTNYGSARRMCSVSSVQGGRILMAQWWDRKRDHDLLCPTARNRSTVDLLFTDPTKDAT